MPKDRMRGVPLYMVADAYEKLGAAPNEAHCATHGDRGAFPRNLLEWKAVRLKAPLEKGVRGTRWRLREESEGGTREASHDVTEVRKSNPPFQS